MKKKILKITIALMLLFGIKAGANNLQINNVSLAGINTTNHFIMVKFDISWENSWRTSTAAPYNWDAAWIFVKYRVNGGEWLQATISATDADHTAPTGSTIDAGSDGMGAFMYRAANGTGSNNWTNAQLRWNYGSNGVADNAANVEVRVIGIEMVYVPQGAFYAGDNATSNYSFKQGSADKDPWYIGSESAMSVTGGTGSGTGLGSTNSEYYYVSSGGSPEDATGAAFSLSANFPKGYNAFYSMKYEITQGQYTEFLNMLNRLQQSDRVESIINTDLITNIYVMSNTITMNYRNTIVCPPSGNGTIIPVIFSTSTAERACNYLGWPDGAAFSDWAGLRPMTELEFEKACRGTLATISGEKAWGSTSYCASSYTLNNEGKMNESIATNYSTTSGNALMATTNNNIIGPLRVGVFAAHPNNSGRVTSGSTYYGVMEMSGNLSEQTISVGRIEGRNFTGINGDGILTSNGRHNVTNWPGHSGGGTGTRGGAWIAIPYWNNNITISGRQEATPMYNYRLYLNGYRAVRCP